MSEEQAGRAGSGEPGALKYLLPPFIALAAAAMMYSALRVAERDPARRCPNGHPVPPSAAFCEDCGARIDDGPG